MHAALAGFRYDVLQELVTGLSSGKINWPEVVRTDVPLNLTKELLQTQSYMDEEDEDLKGNSSAIDPRKNLDFTDRLWTILIGKSL